MLPIPFQSLLIVLGCSGLMKGGPDRCTISESNLETGYGISRDVFSPQPSQQFWLKDAANSIQDSCLPTAIWPGENVDALEV
jgi:hypothetical protein